MCVSALERCVSSCQGFHGQTTGARSPRTLQRATGPQGKIDDGILTLLVRCPGIIRMHAATAGPWTLQLMSTTLLSVT